MHVLDLFNDKERKFLNGGPLEEAEVKTAMSRAAKGHEKYGKKGMQALAKAGREGASEKKLDAIRDQHDKYDESVAGPKNCWPGHRKVGTQPGTGRNAGKRVNDCEKIKEDDVAEATGDVKFDKILKGITNKKQVAKQQKADTKQQARDAFGNMFGGGNPADKLGIRKKDVGEAVALDRSKNPGYPNDPATAKHRLDNAKAILSDPNSDSDSRKAAAAIIAKSKQGVAEGNLNEFAPGGNSASSYYAVTENFVNEFTQQKQEELQDLINAGWTKQDLAQAGTLAGQATDIAHFEQVRDGFLKGLKPGFDAYLRGDTQLKDQLGAYWMENDLPLNQDWEKIYGEPWGDDSEFNEGVAEGMLDNPGEPDSPVAQAIVRRILMQRTDLLAKHGPDRVSAAVDEVADFVGEVDEIGSSDVSGWVKHVEQMLGNMPEQGVAEGEYDSRKPFGVRYKVFAGREGRVTTKEYWTTSSEKLEKAVAKIEALGNFYEIDGYSYPKEQQGVVEVSDATLTSYLTKLDKDNLKHRMDPTKRSDAKRMKSGPNFVKAFTKLDNRKQGVAEGSGANKTYLAMAYLKAVVMAPMGTPEKRRILNWQQILSNQFDIEMDPATLAQMLPQFDSQLKSGQLDKLQNRMASRGELEIGESEQGVAEAGPRMVDQFGKEVQRTSGQTVQRDTKPRELRTGDARSTATGIVTKTDTGIRHEPYSDVTPKPRFVEQGVEEGSKENSKPRIRKYSKMRPDGSKSVRYEVLDYQGRRVSGQGPEGFDNPKNAKEFYYRNYDKLQAPVEESIVETAIDEQGPVETIGMKESSRYWCKNEKRWKDNK